MRPPTGLATSAWEVWGRLASAPRRGGANVPSRSTKAHHIFEHHLHTTSANGRAPIPSRPSWSSQLARGLKSFTRSIYQGTFHSIKSRYNHPHGPYVTSRIDHVATKSGHFHGFANLNHASRRPLKNGLRLRPSLVKSNFVGSKGLGSARQFSSSQPLFANVIHNVPLFLRAAGDRSLDGLDERKWIKTRRTLQKAELNMNTQTNDRLQAAGFMSKKVEMDKYFTALPCEAQVVEEKDATDALVDRSVDLDFDPIILILSVDPTFAFPVSSSTNETNHSPSIVQTFTSIEQAYALHAQRIKALHDRLSHAGVFDDVQHVKTEAVAWMDPITGKEHKEVHVTFDARQWTRKDVRAAIGEWNREGEWWRIIGGEEEESVRSSEQDEPLLMPLPSMFLEDRDDDESMYSYSREEANSVYSTSAASVDAWHEGSSDAEVLFDFQVDDDGTSAAWEEESSGVSDYEDGVRIFLDELDGFGDSFSS
ncbi:BQ5605_C005g03287 [Microbotryum silenes-dioicae]|uniref:BQ5605_C005g03287 protein n=1 Tax=Microbotryum silenes-dioicae TaxID=796604 RepID=A0A2X0PCG1_9BASI|nr:BQ5605_C005g03287 [Microbotryum silenes-dioicae]